MCNGSGVCRKTATGTMCPSFMVTHDEEHSTRGRANALRLALTGQLPAGSLTSQRMWDVMDLCLMCKGCKAECPSNVDVAKLKVEFLAHYYAQHRLSLGTMLMANVAWLNRLGSATAPLANAIAKLPGMAHLTEWFAGVDSRRSLPRFAGKNFSRWFARHAPHAHAGRAGKVVLLDDCLTSYCEPEVNQAAVQLLEQAGYAVERAGLWCCGRAGLSRKGWCGAGGIASARRMRLVGWLEFVDQGLPILRCRTKLPADGWSRQRRISRTCFTSEATTRVKQNSFLVDAWLAEQVAAGKAELTFDPLDATALVHGHCQQKALVGTTGTKRLLGLVPGLSVREVDSGCCGMAGSFGYEHYDISMAIGNRALFPAVKNHADGLVAAPGFSCRHQIADGTGRHALHPLSLVLRQLRRDS